MCLTCSLGAVDNVSNESLRMESLVLLVGHRVSRSFLSSESSYTQMLDVCFRISV